MSIAAFIFSISVAFYFTVPKKELIYDRIRGRVTFASMFWGKNITMPFDKVIYYASTGGDDGIGAYMLQMVRPTNHTFLTTTFSLDSCYEDISLITWYMDRNRPLPPGPVFDPYRDQDFERRKAEGFPPPLYPSQIKTPEATPEQQKEREKHWKDENYIRVIPYKGM